MLKLPRKALWIICLGLLAGADIAPIKADPVTILSLNPARCIALQQGQNCYQKIKIHWLLPQPDDVCLLLNNDSQPLKCWTNSSQEIFTWEFEGNKDAKLKLMSRKNSQVLAEQLLTVAWVYDVNTRRDQHWRLF